MMGDRPEFVAVGHVTLDLTEGGPVPGGAALYASVTAARLGWRAGLLTRGAPSEAEGLLGELEAVVDRGSEVSTTFEIRYWGEGREERKMGSRLRGSKGRGNGEKEERGGREETPFRPAATPITPISIFPHQGGRGKREGRDKRRVVALRAVAPPIDVGRLPAGWEDASVMLLGPVFGDVPPSMAGRFSGSLVGVAPQGWLRRVGESGRVEQSGWYDGSVLERADVVILSELDVVDGRIPERWLRHEGIFILTRGRRGAVMRYEGRWHSLPAYPAVEVDPTGAGDVFAAAFLIRYFETKDAYVAGLFASCAASLSVEGSGAGAIPTREQVERRMSQYAGFKAKALNSDKSKGILVRSLGRRCLAR